MLFKFIFSFLLVSIFSWQNPFAQKIKQTKSVSWTLLREEPYQITSWTFLDEQGQEKSDISLNSFIPSLYTGIPVDSLSLYIGQKLDIELVYLKHFCDEGSYPYPCTTWVATSIQKTPSIKPSGQLLVYPSIGKLVDSQGYVNIRETMSLKSNVIGTITIDPEQYYYFYPTLDPKWMKVVNEPTNEGSIDTGYIFYSRIKLE
jgi:hypothetical protein